MELLMTQLGNAVRGQYNTAMDEINKNDSQLTELVYAQWVNGTGFNTDTTEITLNAASPAIVIRNQFHDLLISTDFTKYRIGLYYFNSQNNKYPHFEGHYTSVVRIPKNQWFTFFINKRDNSAFDSTVLADINLKTTLTNGNNIWTQINENILNINQNTTEINKLKETHNYSTESEIIKKYSTGNQVQGLTSIGDNFLLFSGSSSDPEGYAGKIFVVNKNTGSITENYHNLGHASSCSYIKYNDTLILGNGSLQQTDKPKIQFMKNASQKTNMYQSDSDYFEIPLYNNDSELLTNGYSNALCIGEDYRILYMTARNNSGYKLYKIILGVGTANYSDQWGTYTYRGENDYNGTCKVVETFDFPTYTQLQCFIYKHGCFYVLDGVSSITIHKIQLKNLTFTSLDNFTLPLIDDEGNTISSEPEGICAINNNIYVSDYNSSLHYFRLVETGII